ncbi:PKD domain-containing protein [Taibaiella koreensis]|uniref:PKD domain-containing protein n=1 Tax=Taibaiella koreensis TaxID=1268548 RepID=UPI000E59BBFD|nr:PKD domain-containing protein [Taibaiella koreensis]
MILRLRVLIPSLLTLCFLLLIPQLLQAQLPDCSPTGHTVYVHTNNIENWDITAPLVTGTNPSTNTIAMPPGAVGLAVANNLNDPTGPSPTFYTTAGGNFYYYNGTGWINTGHTASTVNIGGGGNFVYGLEGGTGTVYKYDGTGNATMLLVVPGFAAGGGGGPFDIVADCAGNFYVLRTLAPAWLRKYSPAGTLLQEWEVTGAVSTGSGGGFAIVGNMMYHHNAGLQQGVIGATTVVCTPVTGPFPSPGDFASCPVGGAGTASTNDTVFNCIPGTAKSITASGTAPFTHTIISGTGTITGTGPSFGVTCDQPVTIALTSTSNSTCSPIAYDTIMVVPAPSVNAGPDDTLYGCARYTGTLHGTLSGSTSWVNYTYGWTPSGLITSGANTPNPVIAPVADTIYKLTVTTGPDQGGCSISDSLRIKVVDESILPDYQFSINLGCTEDTVHFTNQSIRGTKSFWYFGDGSTDTLTHPQHIYTSQDNYQVKLISSNYLCKDSVIKIVDTRHPLAAAFTTDRDTLCLGTSINYTNNSTVSLQPASYFWDFGDGTSETFSNPSHVYTVPGTYRIMLAIHDRLPCYDTAYHTVVVDSTPQVSLLLDNHDICTGQTATITASYTHSGNIGLDWSFGDGNLATDINPASHAYELPGTYFIHLKARYRVCEEKDAQDSVNVHALPLVNLGPDTTLCLDAAPFFLSNLATAGTGDRYRWNTGDTTGVLRIAHDGTYSLTVTTVYDCNATDAVVVKKDCYIDVPNSFTPNGDGVNDYFFPRQLLSRSVGAFTMKVFNRWGQIVYETSNRNGRGWDGRFNDKEQPSGVYLYQINVILENGRTEQFTGNVTLLR